MHYEYEKYGLYGVMHSATYQSVVTGKASIFQSKRRSFCSGKQCTVDLILGIANNNLLYKEATVYEVKICSTSSYSSAPGLRCIVMQRTQQAIKRGQPMQYAAKLQASYALQYTCRLRHKHVRGIVGTFRITEISNVTVAHVDADLNRGCLAMRGPFRRSSAVVTTYSVVIGLCTSSQKIFQLSTYVTSRPIYGLAYKFSSFYSIDNLCYVLSACVLRKQALSRVKYYYNATVYDNQQNTAATIMTVQA